MHRYLTVPLAFMIAIAAAAQQPPAQSTAAPPAAAPAQAAPADSAQAGAAQPAAQPLQQQTQPAADIPQADAGAARPNASALAPAAPVSPADNDKIFYQEARLVEQMHKFSPVVETYIQNMKPDQTFGAVPASDNYFIGRLVLNEKGMQDKVYEQKKVNLGTRFLERIDSFYKMNYVPLGFMQLLFLNVNFDKQHYDLKYLHQEFMGAVRTRVYDVMYKPHQKGTHFVGRIWVEDEGFHIVRFNGTYEPRSRSHFYFHFDSWRVNLQPDMWLPSYVYTEETDTKYMMVRHLTMKGQSRIWGYSLTLPGGNGEFSDIQVEPSENVEDNSDTAGHNEVIPLRSQRMWEREAENNVLDRLQRAGVLAPPSDVTKVLETVVNNLVVTNNLVLDPEVRCRVMLTTPLESFTIGHTIVISRGMLDVLPDEASLAAVLAHELGHIVLGHRIDTRYSFSDRMLFPDEEAFRRIALARRDNEEQDADKKALELLKNSPYKDKLGEAGLFLKALQERSGELKSLISPHYGNRIARGDAVLRLAQLEQSSPALKDSDVKQIPALPLGARVQVDPWSDKLMLMKAKPLPIYSARDKMEFEVTPVYPDLVRYGTAQQPVVAEKRNP
ncbi:MAG TPA: M48 family metalloprotease [Terriglobales bacterium]|nr:M48 family metalloprotease [Terriglobales bacterium]